MNLILGLIILIVAIAIIEISKFRLVSILLGILGALLTISSILEGILLEIIPLALFSIIFVPLVLYVSTIKTKTDEESPLISRLPAFGLLLILMIIAYTMAIYFFNDFSIIWPLILVGAYGLLIKTDMRKSVASLSILTYSIHLLIPTFDIIIDSLLLFLSAILIIVLLFFAYRIFLLKGSLSTRDLKDLKF